MLDENLRHGARLQRTDTKKGFRTTRARKRDRISTNVVGDLHPANQAIYDDLVEGSAGAPIEVDSDSD